MTTVVRNLPSARSQVNLLIRSVVLESLRRREFYVLLLFMGIFVLGAGVVRLVGIENPATATFLLNLGLTLAFGFAKLITLLTAARQFPDELEHRTLYPLLARPLSRTTYLFSKWAAASLIGVVTLAILFVAVYLPVPLMEHYSAVTLFQVLVLEVCAIFVVAALAILLSLLLPKMLSIVLIALLVLAAGRLVTMLHNRASGTAVQPLIKWLTGYIPDFTRWDILVRYTDGLPPISALDWYLRILYAVAFIAFPLALSGLLLNRRSL